MRTKRVAYRSLTACLGLLIAQPCFGVGVPLTDTVLFGRVYSKAGEQRVGQLAQGERVVVAARGVRDGAGRLIILGEAEALRGPSGGLQEFYVIRLRRFDGTSTDADRGYVLAGDVLRIFLDNGDDSDGDGDPLDADEEVAETIVSEQFVTDAQLDIRLLDLNRPGGAEDADADGLPDAWEMQYLQGTSQGPLDDPLGNGVINFAAWALGLDPLVDNTSRLPFLSREQGGVLYFFYRRAATETGVQYQVQVADSVAGPSWTTLDLIPVDIGSDGASRILRVEIPGGADQDHRYFRLQLSR